MQRREFLYGLNASLGSIALTSLLADDGIASVNGPKATGNNAPTDGDGKKRHFGNAKARHCIFLYMEGGPSHIDTFDPKPKLNELHLKEFHRSGEEQSAMSSGKRYYVQSPFRFHNHGESGAPMCEHWKHLPKVADELCFFRGCQVESVNHPTANYHVNTGNRFGGDPSLGAWVTYGLGTENSNLPGFVVLPELSYPQGGSANWSNGFLPTQLQGTALRAKGSPILDIRPRKEFTVDHQRKRLDFLNQLNRSHALQRPDQRDLMARIENYELAFRMQSQVPELVDLSDESQQTLDAYGIGRPSDNFSKRCLLARKLVEKGVRFVQLYASTWDSHDYLAKAHGALIPTVDQPIAALIADLKQRGLLEETLIVWMGEFGRTPDNGVRGGGIAYGRDHNPNAMTVWLAGGGTKAGHTIGATDELGASAVEEVHPLRNLHVTLLKILGLDDNKLTYYHAGRFKQLSQFGGKPIDGLIA